MPDILDLVRATRKAALRDPEKVQPGQRYFYGPSAKYEVEGCEPGAPCCVVGHGMSDLGITYDDIEDLNSAVVEKVIASLSLFNYEYFNAEHGKAFRWLNTIQQRQDEGDSWATAMITADRTAYGDSLEGVPTTDCNPED